MDKSFSPMKNSSARRVVLTGIGMVTPLGVGKESNWQSLMAGQSGIRKITKFDTSRYTSRIAGELIDFDPLQFLDKKEARKMDPFIQYALSAAQLAVKDSGLEPSRLESERTGVLVGSGIGGIGTIEEQLKILQEKGPGRVSPFFLVAAIINEAAGQISIMFRAKGPNSAVCTACATSTHSIGDAFRIIAYGDADIMIAGGSEAPITPLGLAGFCSMRALSVRNDAPEKSSRPFELERDGFVMGEGAGIVILEELVSALERGAHIYAEVIGYGMSSDAYHVTAPSREGEGAVQSMRNAIQDAGIEPREVDYINAHGTSTPWNDKIETLAIKKLFGDHAHKLAVSSSKSMTGHLLGAAGAVEAAITSLSLDKQILTPTINYEKPDPECDLDYVPNKPRKGSFTYGLSNSFGFGGTNATLLLKKFEA